VIKDFKCSNTPDETLHFRKLVHYLRRMHWISFCKSIARNLAVLPVVAGAWRPMTRRLSILNYHRVYRDAVSNEKFNPNLALSVSHQDFDSQLAFIKRVGKFVTLEEAVSIYSRGQERSRGGVAITFDDGFRDNMTVALPIAEKYEAPIAIFITSGFIDRAADLWWEEHTFIINRLERLYLQLSGDTLRWELSTLEDKNRAASDLRSLFKGMDLTRQKEAMQQLRSQCSERYSYDSEMLSWDEVQKLAAHPLVTLGVHTVNHPVLSRLTPEEVVCELQQSRERLQSKIGVRLEYFAYPMGQSAYASYREFQITEQCQFKAAFTAGPSEKLSEGSERLFQIPRIPVDHCDTLKSFAWKASGL
jgi:peptidoglycan/xylan/chitin deacetylase (PgdA/CDA1 family)